MAVSSAVELCYLLFCTKEEPKPKSLWSHVQAVKKLLALVTKVCLRSNSAF